MIKLKKLLIRFLVVLLALQGAIAAQLLNLQPAKAGFDTPEVIINELMWMGSTSSTADEWIELYNTTQGAVDIGGWTLANSGLPAIPVGATIPANGYYLVANYSETSSSSVLNVAPDWVTTALSLNNSCAQIDLIRADLTTADSMGCDGSSYFAGLNGALDKRAMERNIAVADGTLLTSWHTAVGFANLDSDALGANLATPKFVNDTTAATSGAVNDGPADDQDFTANASTLEANWSGFADSESGLDHYLAGVGTAPGLDDIVGFEVESSTTHSFAIPAGWLENETYFVSVKAVNGVNLESKATSSDGITLNTADPEPPTNLTAADQPDDNGGSIRLDWVASISADVTSYQVNFRKLGEVPWQMLNVGMATNAVVSGLENAPATYEFTVEAVDFNSQHSLPTATVTAQAHDNLAPVINATKVTVNQNRPGNNDSVVGAEGAANEPGVTVNILSRLPGDPSAILINSVLSNADGSFPALGIGDNQYAAVWLQLVDAAGNGSIALELSNDIIGPQPATLQRLKASCPTEICRTEIGWSANSPDSAFYQVGYRKDTQDQRTLELTQTTVLLDLAAGETYEFRVYAFDGFGNPAGPSNSFLVALVKGVITTVKWENGSQVTITETISGSLETLSDEIVETGEAFVPSARAAEKSARAPETRVEPTSNQASNQDWVRIFVVVILLLIVAGSFYALSRTLQPTGEEPFDKRAKKSAAATKRKTKQRRPRKS